MRRVRIANLPPEVPDAVIRTVLSSYGEVQGVQAETWSRVYRCTVANGIRIASIALTKHIPSHVTMAGNRVPVSYEGQPMTFYGCNGTGHLYQACPMRRPVTQASAEVVYTHEEENPMECGTREQEKETGDTQRKTQIKQ
jgi:hypothetical protein